MQHLAGPQYYKSCRDQTVWSQATNSPMQQDCQKRNLKNFRTKGWANLNFFCLVNCSNANEMRKYGLFSLTFQSEVLLKINQTCECNCTPYGHIDASHLHTVSVLTGKTEDKAKLQCQVSIKGSYTHFHKNGITYANTKVFLQGSCFLWLTAHI